LIQRNKIPEIKTSGNLISEESIMMFDGTFVGGIARNIPTAEKQHAPMNIALSKIIPWSNERPSEIPMKTVIRVIAIPKMIEAIISPRTMASIVIGHDASRSKVLACPSQGKIAGETAVALKRSVIPINPEIRNERGSWRLPIKKARKRKNGIKTPKIRTGPLR
jgi:hypothetical protein